MPKNKSSELVSRFKLMWLDMNICPDDDFSEWIAFHLNALSEMDTSEDESLAKLIRLLKALNVNNRVKFIRQAKALMRKHLTEYISLDNEDLFCDIADLYRVSKSITLAIEHVTGNLNRSLERNADAYRTANLMINWGHSCRKEYRAASDAIERDAAKLVVLDNLVVMIEQSNRSRLNITDIGVMLMTLEWGKLITLEQKKELYPSLVIRVERL